MSVEKCIPIRTKHFVGIVLIYIQREFFAASQYVIENTIVAACGIHPDSI